VPVAAGCSEAASNTADAGRPFRERTALIDLESFQLADAASDPFDDRPPDPIACAVDGHIVEVFGGALVYSIYSDKCRYVTAVQPSLADVYQGEVVRARFWHFALIAPEPAEAHVMIALDGTRDGLERRIAIPAESALISETWRATRDYPRGTPVYFHVHNHGNNEYLLIELSTGTEDPDRVDEDTAVER
jgi:hypothetical protein